MKKALPYFFLLLYMCDAVYAQRRKIDSLRMRLKTQKEDSNKAIVLQNLAYQVYLNNNYDSAIIINKQAVDLATALNYLPGLEWEYRLYGNIYKSQGSYDKSMEDDRKSLEIAEKLGDKKGIGFAYNNMGLVYMYQGNYPQALDCELKSLKIKEEIHDTKTINTTYGNIGSIYFGMNDYKNAFLYNKKALVVDSAAKDLANEGVDYSNMGNVFRQTGEYEKALEYYFRALKMEEQANDKYNQDLVNGNIGSTYESEKKLEEALLYYFKSLALAKEIGDKDGIGFTYENIGAAYTNLKQYTVAKKYFDSSYVLAKAIGEKEVLTSYYSNNAKLDSILGDYKGAFNNYENYRRYRDSMSNEEATKKVVGEQMQYEFDKKRALQQAEQDRQDAVRDEKLKQQKQLNWFIAGASVLVLALSWLAFNRYRLKQKNEYQQQLNQKQKEQAIAVMGTQEEERKRIAEDIHDSLGQLLSTAKLNIQSLGNNGAVNIDNPLTLLNQAVAEIRDISFNLMPKTLEEEGLIPALQELATRVNNSGIVKVSLHIHDAEDIKLEKQAQFTVYRIIQEAVNNALKYSGAKEINVQLLKDESSLIVMVEDDGKGFDLDKIKTGRGLKNMVSRSEWLNGKLAIDSGLGGGTTISVEIPIA